MRRTIRVARLCAVVWLLTSAGGCADAGRGPAPSAPVVAVSLPPHAAVVRQLVPDSVEVVCLLRSGDDPEHYEPTPATLAAVQRAEVFFMAGNLAFERELVGRLLPQRPDARVVNVSEGVALLRGGHGGHDAVDPHTWASVRNMRRMARNMSAALSRLWPDDTAGVARCQRALDARLDSLDNALARRLAAHRGEAFVVYHPALSYFAHDYGLRQVALQAREGEAAVEELRHGVAAARGRGARVFFATDRQADGLCATLNADIGARMVTFNPLAYDWENELQTITYAFDPDK